MARWSEAVWRPVRNHGGAMAKGRPITVTMHHAVANGSLYNVFNGSRKASTHFWIAKDGRAEQYVDTGVISWGGVNHNSYAISVETEGCATPPHAEPMTEAMINTFARLLAWANRTHGIPFVKSESVSQPGFNYHRVRDAGVATGCPCDVRLRMRDEIIRRAKGAVPAPTPPPPQPQPLEEDKMMDSALEDNGNTSVFLVGPQRRTVWIVHQNAGSTGWSGGETGKRVAGFRRFRDAPDGRTIRSISAETNAAGVTHLWVNLDNSSTVYTWKRKGESVWQDGLRPFAPTP